MHGESRREELDYFAKACAPSRRNIDFVIAIVIGCRADVPAQNSVAGKGAFALSLLSVDDGLSSERRHGS